MEHNEFEHRHVSPTTPLALKPTFPASGVTRNILTCLDSSAADETGHAYPPQGSKQSSSEGPGKASSDSHEDYHVLHYEAQERAIAADEEGAISGIGHIGRMNHTGPISQLERTLLEMKERIVHLEGRLAASPENNGDKQFQAPLDGVQAAPEAAIIVADTVDGSLGQQKMIPVLRHKSWFDFMNKYAEDEEDYAIEILLGEPEYYLPAKDPEKLERRLDKGRSLIQEVDSRANPAAAIHMDESLEIPERIRINSIQILNALASIDKSIDTTGPIVMLRPFKFLVHYEDHIRDLVRSMEKNLKELDESTLTESSTSDSAPVRSRVDGTVPTEDMIVKQETLEHMRCLTKFIDEYIEPTMDRLHDGTGSKIRFADLWYLFQPGETIFMPLRYSTGPISMDAAMAAPEIFQDRYKLTWRVASVGGGRPNLSVTQNRDARLKCNTFKVNCYYIDFDGRYFCPTIHTLAIMPFSGEQDITSLEFYPMRYMRDPEESLKEHNETGQQVFDCITSPFTHYYYAGHTLGSRQPCGCSITSDAPSQEHIESEVIVDFRTTLIQKPSWKPKVLAWKSPPVDRQELQEAYPVRYWSDRSKSKLLNLTHDYIYDDFGIDSERSTVFRENEPIFTPIPSGWLSNASMVTEKDLLLLPGRVFGFVLRTRTFAPLWLWLLQPIKPQNEGLRDLQLKDDSFKDTIQALVRTHFLQKTVQQRKSKFEYDLVRGKGKGLVVLLHGAPGVGKTFTAESIAAANGRPLFQITCGDLGLTPSEVEKGLKEIFRFAQLWNCVLLLDECDIFLAQRSKTDIQRNSLVSVFLRVLEFYTGVLFLTTNRVGVLDDAIKSRITWIAYYPPLDKSQTKKIWEVNIKLLSERNSRLQIDRKGILDFAKEHWRDSAARDCAWNGRQIQNAFKVAAALAEWDAYSPNVQHQIDTRLPEEDVPSHLKLTANHFETIAKATRIFDQYHQEVTGFSERQRAFNLMERADDYPVDDGIGSFRQPSSLAIPQAYGAANVSPVLSPSLHRSSDHGQQKPSISSGTSSKKRSFSNVGPKDQAMKRPRLNKTATSSALSPEIKTSEYNSIKKGRRRASSNREMTRQQDIHVDRSDMWEAESSDEQALEVGDATPEDNGEGEESDW